jgi:hypothetical protein
LAELRQYQALLKALPTNSEVKKIQMNVNALATYLENILGGGGNMRAGTSEATSDENGGTVAEREGRESANAYRAAQKEFSSVTVSIDDAAARAKETEERNAFFYKTVSALLYVIGWTLTLGGKLSGDKPVVGIAD